MTVVAAPSTCPACDRPPQRSLRLSNGSDLLRCPQCRMGWWEWPAFDPSAFYDQSYFQSAGDSKGYNDYASLEAGVRRTARSRLARLATMADPRPNRSASNVRQTLFEIGCGTGLFLDEARKAGWVVAGNEVSTYGAEVARGRGLQVDSSPIEESGIAPLAGGNAGTGIGYDCVVFWDVIEHVRDPQKVIDIAAGALRPGGLLALSTGDITSWCARFSGAKWHLFNLPEHLYFFSPESLRRMLDRAACDVVKRRDEVNWVPASYIVERLQKPLWGRARITLPRLTANWVIPATLGDVMGLYCVRRTGGNAAGEKRAGHP